MKNIPENSDNPDKQSGKTIPKVKVLSRVLAALFDYFIVFFSTSYTSYYANIPYDYTVIIPISFGLFYFGIGNSRISNGRTLGKLLFGLQTRATTAFRTTEPSLNSFPTQNADHLLTVRASMLRYLFLYGFLYLSLGAPDAIYRAWSVHGEVWLLRLHILIIGAYFSASIIFFLFSPLHQAFHDLISNSIVVPKSMGPEFNVLLQTKVKKRYFGFALLGGTVLSALSFLQSIDSQNEVVQFVSHRFQLENAFPIRISSQGIRGNNLIVVAIVISNERTPVDSWLASNLTKMAVEKGAINTVEVASVDWIFVPSRRIPRGTEVPNTDTRRRFTVDTKTLDVRELPLDQGAES